MTPKDVLPNSCDSTVESISIIFYSVTMWGMTIYSHIITELFSPALLYTFYIIRHKSILGINVKSPILFTRDTVAEKIKILNN